MKPIPRFLVLRGGAIGDFILTLPVLQLLREHWPSAHIELMCYPHIGQLIRNTELIDAMRSLDQAGMAEFFSLRPDFTQTQIDYIRSFDIIFTYLHDPGNIVYENLLQAGARQVIYGSPLVKGAHAIDFLLKPLQELALYPDNATPQLRLPETVLQSGEQWLHDHKLHGKVVAIHPGSGSPTKNWAVERFSALAHNIQQDENTTCLFIIGEADRAVEEVLSVQLPHIPMLRGTTLTLVAAVLAHCSAFIGNDSGITHIAAALNMPVIALFGPTDHTTWGPRGDHVHLLHAANGDLSDISLQSVQNALRQLT